MWDPRTNRWLVEIRYPDGARQRRRFRRERDALRLWSAEQTKIESGAWDAQAPKNVTFGTADVKLRRSQQVAHSTVDKDLALAEYRDYSKIQNRAHTTYVEPALKVWEAHLEAGKLLVKISTAQVEDVKLRRSQQVAHSTVDKDLAVLKSFFNWCIGRGLAVSNPVRRVKFFNDDNSRLRYLTETEYNQLIDAARTIDHSPDLPEKIILSVHTGLRRGSLFNLKWDHVDFLNSVIRIPRTKSGHPHSIPLNKSAVVTCSNSTHTACRILPTCFRIGVGAKLATWSRA